MPTNECNTDNADYDRLSNVTRDQLVVGLIKLKTLTSIYHQLNVNKCQ